MSSTNGCIYIIDFQFRARKQAARVRLYVPMTGLESSRSLGERDQKLYYWHAFDKDLQITSDQEYKASGMGMRS